jgi:hypothetical protein
MANLRLVSNIVDDSRTIRMRFTASLDPLINTGNFVMESLSVGIDNPIVKSVEINKNIVTLIVSPMFEAAAYQITLASTPAQRFKSLNGDAFILEDGVTNILAVTGPEDSANIIRDVLIGYLQNNIYEMNDGGLVRTTINQQANSLLRALYDIRQLKSDNYLGFLVENEAHERGKGPTDRLNEEGAFKILRVGKDITGTQLVSKINFTEFPSDPITLQFKQVSNEVLSAGSGPGTFNQNTLTLSNRFVTKVTSMVIAYQNGTSATYDLASYGYQVKDSRYDQQIASTLLTLEDNQVRISDSALAAGFVLPGSGDNVFIGYQFKNKGREIIDGYTSVFRVSKTTRYTAEPLTTRFFLPNAPIVNSDGSDLTSGGIEWLDPESNPPFSQPHPSFLRQIPFRLDSTPQNIGEWSVDYQTGEVLCYGRSLTDTDGTGSVPPTATFYSKIFYSDVLDYTFDVDLVELVANPDRDLVGATATIQFTYEDNFIEDIDFVGQVHKESLNERIDNRLISINAIRPLNTPVTNVFRILNETSGEIYPILRYNDNTIYFSSSTPPNVIDTQRERGGFILIENELLISSEELISASAVRIMKVNLLQSRIMSSTEDVVGSSWNTSAVFSRNDIFIRELYWDGQTSSITINTNRLNVGDYQIDYQNGIIYIGVAHAQTQDLGTIVYRAPQVEPLNPHVLAVSDIYYSISPLLGKSRSIPVREFSEGSILPNSFDRADERFTNADTTKQYVVSGGSISVTDDIKDVRYLFDLYDLNHSSTPINFAPATTSTANIIQLDSTGITITETLTIQPGGILNATFRSSGIEISSTLTAIRVTDGVNLFDGAESHSGYNITLSGFGSPIAGQIVTVRYCLQMNGSATPVVDYNRGDYYIDYSFLADEILISYEYGDNVIDWSGSDAINEGDIYYTTYRAGALRSGLLDNFGSLVNISLLNNLDTDLQRETYRDALKAALQSFPLGPTIKAIKGIGSHISHTEPVIEESLFETWSLGFSYLFKNKIKTTGDVRLLPGKYDLGALVDQPGQTITFPVSDSLRLEEGTLETYVIPEWDGLDNDATLTFQIFLNGSLIPQTNVYIGSNSHNPTYDVNGKFTVNRKDASGTIGLPASIFTQVGLFIHYDPTEKFWKLHAKNKLGFLDGYSYTGTIESSGEIYNAQSIPGLGEINDVLRSDNNKIYFEFHIDSNDTVSPDGYTDGYQLDGYHPGDGYSAGFSYDGIRFMADDLHYIFDFGASSTKERFSIFKDGRGYLNFQIYDGGLGGRINQYTVSSDIRDWMSGEKHHVAVAWRLNTTERRDEMHLFIDGFEVPNIIKYGGRPTATSTDPFRSIKPEIIAGTVSRPIRVGGDLSTQISSQLVTSASVNFQSAGILPGDYLTINEVGFSVYLITNVSGYTLTLAGAMPATLPDASFTVNAITYNVSSPIDLYTNILVTLLKPSGVEVEQPGLRAAIPHYSIGKNTLGQNTLKLLGDADVGDQVLIRTLGLNFRGCREQQFIWGNTTSVLKTQLPTPFNLDEVEITSVLLPYIVVGPSNSTVSLGTFTSTLSPTQPSSSTEGRYLKVRISGGNVNFSTATTVTITGTTAAGPTSEIVTFTSPTTKQTVNKFKTITSAKVITTPLSTSSNSVGIEIREADPITVSEGNNLYPVILYSYQTLVGTNGSGNSSTTFDDSAGLFTSEMVGQKLVITSPAGSAGTYTITAFTSTTSIEVSPSLPTTFTGGAYKVYNLAISRSGFQNGYFTFQTAGTAAQPYYLPQGFYEIKYSTHLQIPFSTAQYDGYIGSDRLGNNQADAIIDEFVVYKSIKTDTRVGEAVVDGTTTITTDANRVKALVKSSDTSLLLHFNSLPFVSDTDVWVTADKQFIQSADSVNGEFGKSLAVINRPYRINNAGALSTVSEGTVEFWISPRFDTYNDATTRYYFDANSATVESTISISKGTIKIKGTTLKVVSVKLTSQLDGIDYFNGGSIADDNQTIQLGTPLPFQQTPVTITYIAKSLNGDRLSIYKNTTGAIIFEVTSGGVVYQTQQQVFWQRDTWHKVRATFKFNRKDNNDEMRLWVDGSENGTILFGSGLLFGTGVVFGQSYLTGSNKFVADLNFHDPINELLVGSDYLGAHLAQARFDNLRISNTSRNPTVIGGQSKDITFTSNLDQAFPVIKDAFTTYLLDFSALERKINDFAIVRNDHFGLFDFVIKIFDSFGIIGEQVRVKEILETLIQTLKPANSRATILYK